MRGLLVAWRSGSFQCRVVNDPVKERGNDATDKNRDRPDYRADEDKVIVPVVQLPGVDEDRSAERDMHQQGRKQRENRPNAERGGQSLEVDIHFPNPLLPFAIV
jgi:hypothetical protein